MKAKIIINMDNAAFEDNPAELVRILQEIVLFAVYDGPIERELTDINGNHVGTFIVK